MTWSLLSPLIIVGVAGAIVVAERIWPYDRGQPVVRRGFWMDLLLYGLLQSYVLGLLIGWLIDGLDDATGASTYGLVSGWPIGVQLVFFIVTHDLYIYLFHRWQHSSPTLWRLHEAHHSVTEIDWVAGSRSHPLEILINQSIEFGAMILLGAAPELPLIKGTVSACWGMWIHANLDVRTGPLQRLINGPEMHRWHHAADLEPPGRNFATKLAIWDWLFGTAYRPAGRKPDAYGLFEGEAFPQGYLGQVMAAFRRSSRPEQR